MLKLIFRLAFIFLLSQYTCAQSIIHGVVLEVDNYGARKPIAKGSSVFIPGISTTTIKDNDGKYSLNLSNCSQCQPGKPIKIYVNSELGYHIENTVLPASNNIDIEVKNNNKLVITGIVRNKRTGAFIKDIIVRAIIPNYDIDTGKVTSDENGIFRIFLRKEGIANLQAIKLLLSDGAQTKYQDKEITVFLNKYEPIKVEMEECRSCGIKNSFEINSFERTKTWLEAGDLITIKASGSMRLGTFVGPSGPEGIPTGVIDISLETYSIHKQWNHGVLLFKFGKNDEWKFYDLNKENQYIVQEDGYLWFGINDSKRGDNKGAYDVEILVRK